MSFSSVFFNSVFQGWLFRVAAVVYLRVDDKDGNDVDDDDNDDVNDDDDDDVDAAEQWLEGGSWGSLESDPLMARRTLKKWTDAFLVMTTEKEIFYT